MRVCLFSICLLAVLAMSSVPAWSGLGLGGTTLTVAPTDLIFDTDDYSTSPHGLSGDFGGSYKMTISGAPDAVQLHFLLPAGISAGDRLTFRLAHSYLGNFSHTRFWFGPGASPTFIYNNEAIRGSEPVNTPYEVTWTADQTYPAGAHITWRSSIWPGTATYWFLGMDVERNDTTPPTIAVSGLPEKLWPPNHQMVRIEPALNITDDCDPDPDLVLTVTSNEPDDGLGDGDTSDDIVVHSPTRIDLRAERSGTGSGRIYTLTWIATDAAGNESSYTAQISVPKSAGKRK